MAPDKKQWRKRYLIPMWLVELIVLGIYFVLAIIGLSFAQDVKDNFDNDDYTVRVASAAYGIVIAFSGALILLTVIEIILASTHKLKPAFFLSSACFKAVICLVYFILNVVGAASVGGASIAGIILSLAATIATILQVVYGSIIVHRTRKGFYNYGAVAHKDGNEVEMGAGHHQHTGVTYQ